MSISLSSIRFLAIAMATLMSGCSATYGRRAVKSASASAYSVSHPPVYIYPSPAEIQHNAFKSGYAATARAAASGYAAGAKAAAAAAAAALASMPNYYGAHGSAQGGGGAYGAPPTLAYGPALGAAPFPMGGYGAAAGFPMAGYGAHAGQFIDRHLDSASLNY